MLQLLKYKLGLLAPAEEQAYVAQAQARADAAACRQCTEYRDWLLQYSPGVRFLVDETNKLGGNIGPQNIVCAKCDDTKAGGFHGQLGILLCQDRLRSRAHAEDTLAHELVHAYDFCRFDVDLADLKHHACTEVRASALSGECSMLNEFLRLNFKANRGLQACVRRRAVLSVMANPHCGSRAEAEAAVDAVFPHCFSDTRPFDEIWR